jgi:uroporphyrinogen-III decarboxylase
MTMKDAVKTAFRFEEIRPTPYTIWYDSAMKAKLDHHYGGSVWQDSIHDHIIRITVDWRPRRFASDDIFFDIHGSRWKTGDPVHLIEPVLKEPVLGDFSIPSYLPYLRSSIKNSSNRMEWPGRYALPLDETSRLLESIKDTHFTVVDFGYGVFESAWMMRGYEEFLIDLVTEPVFAAGLLDMLLDRHLELLDVLLELPCDAIMLTDDFGDQHGVTIGPQRWRKMVKPLMQMEYERIHAAGKLTFHHSCGNIFDIVPDLIDCGLDVLQSVQSEAMPVYELKKQYGNHIGLWGALGTQRLLPFGTPDAVRHEVNQLKKELGRGGGYVFSTSKPLTGEVPLENAIALIEEAIRSDEPT